MAASSASDKTIPSAVCSLCGNIVRFQWALRVGDRIFHTRCDDHTLRFVEGLTGQSPFICQKCSLPVTDKTFKRVGHQIYHENCLKCGVCGHPITDLACYQVENTHYCPQCHSGSKRDEIVPLQDAEVESTESKTVDCT